MKNHWKIIAILVVVIGGLGAIGWHAAQFFGRVLQTVYVQPGEIEKLADEAAAAIVAEWDPQAIKPYASDEYFLTQQESAFATWLSYAELGTPVTVKPCIVTSLHVTNDRGTALAKCPATFPGSDGELSFDYNNDSGEWKIATFEASLKPAT